MTLDNIYEQALSEKRMQFELVMWFGQTFPELSGCLMEINNDTYSRNHAMKRKSMGMVKSASDMVLHAYKRVVFIELKAPGSRHDYLHILSQLEFGRQHMKHGAWFIMSANLDIIKDFVSSIINNDTDNALFLQNESLKEIENKLNEKSKTIKF